MTEQLYALLPTAIRQADSATPGQPLRALLTAIEEQADRVHADIAQLYENWFIETCAPWAVPYVGALVGVPAPLGDEPPPQRADVANAIANRRRKGTLDVLAALAWDLTGWPAVALEDERAVAATCARLGVPAARQRTLDLRDRATLAALRDPRSLAARGCAASGPHAIGSVSVVVSRMRAARVSRSDAACVAAQGDHCFTFDPLGFDTALVSALQPLPVVLRRPDLLSEYGVHGSVAIWTRSPGARERLELVGAERIVSADLRMWRPKLEPDEVAVDVERGRLCFAPGHAPDGVVVRYAYGAWADLGAGEYARDITPIERRFLVAHGGREEHHHLRGALGRWKASHAPRAAIEFADSHVYDESDLHIALAERQYLEVRAADGARPIVRIEDRSAGRLDALRISGAKESTLVLDGLVLARRGIEIGGEIGTVILRRCTLVPAECPIVLRSPTVRLVIEQSIVGDIRAVEDQTRQLPNRLEIADSVVGAHGRADAIGAPDAPVAFVDVRIARSTVFGRVRVHGITLVENAIVTGALVVRRRESGCLRYSYAGPLSQAPAAYAGVAHPPPVFVSRAFGTPGYARLASDCPPEIVAGAEERNEMGAFFNARFGHKAAALQARLKTFVPPDVRVGIRYVGEL